MSGDLIWLDSSPEGEQNFHQFLHTTPHWEPWKWTFLKDWQALRQAQPLAAVCPLWVESGCQFPAIDAAQIAQALPGVPLFAWLTPEQAELAWKASQSDLAGVVVKTHGAQPWRSLAESLCSLLKQSQLKNPLDGVAEIVAWQDQKVSYSWQSHDSELRGDLLSFLQLKADMLGKTLGWEPKQLSLGPGPQPTLVHFSPNGILLLVADPQGRSQSDWGCYQALRDRGFQP